MVTSYSFLLFLCADGPAVCADSTSIRCSPTQPICCPPAQTCCSDERGVASSCTAAGGSCCAGGQSCAADRACCGTGGEKKKQNKKKNLFSKNRMYAAWGCLLWNVSMLCGAGLFFGFLRRRVGKWGSELKVCFHLVNDCGHARCGLALKLRVNIKRAQRMRGVIICSFYAMKLAITTIANSIRVFPARCRSVSAAKAPPVYPFQKLCTSVS
jgi:hypothetical protein